MNKNLNLALCVGFLASIMLLGIFNLSRASAAATWYVKSGGSDANDCLTPGTACASIPGALAKAAPDDTILVTAETYTGTGPDVVLIDKNITLSGGWNQSFSDQSGMTVLDGQNSRTVLEIMQPATAYLGYFTLQNGINNASAGGIIIWGTLTVDHCTVQNNQGTDIAGGGITIYGTLVLQWSTVRNNTGPGVYNWQDAGPLTILNSTISGNSGVGVRVHNQDASIVNSTISGNTNKSYYADGGGIYYLSGVGKSLVLKNDTITGNHAQFAGGGINVDSTYGGQLLLQNTILSGNLADLGSDCYGTIDSQGYNIIGDTINCTFNSADGDQPNTDPKIGVLQDNGGPTFTQWIYSDSPAIDAGNPAGCVDQLGNPLLVDQRGFPRPLDGDSDGNNICDIGAYELDPNNPPPPSPHASWYVSTSGNDTNDCQAPASPCATIQAAVEKSASGDSIYITAGNFGEPSGLEVIRIDKSLSLSGGWNPDFTDLAGYTVIDGEDTKRGITILDTLNVYIDSFIIQNCRSLGESGGGIYTGYMTKLTLTNSIVAGNTTEKPGPIEPSYGVGGGIGMATSGRLTIENSLLIGNTSGSGGAIYSAECMVKITGSIITFNTAPTGGGIASKINGRIELDYSEVTNNYSTNWGGGIDASDTYLILNYSKVEHNTAGGSGGGVHGHTMLINHSSISGNTSSSGGGIYTMYTAEINNSAVLYNTSYGNGGGIYSSNELYLTNTTIAYNRATSLYNNDADGGGIFRAGGPDLQASNVTIVKNIAKRAGGGIWSNTSPVTLRNSILADNQAVTGPDCNSLIHSDGYNLVGDMMGCNFIPATGDLTDIDPLLDRPFGYPGTVAVKADSPAIDAGNPSGCVDWMGNPITVDQIGTQRPLDGDGNGSTVCDIGAFEYNPALPPRWLFMPLLTKQ